MAADLWTHDFPLIGVLHLPPLPGAPVGSPGLQAVIDRALADAEALALGGAQGLIVENLGDAPFSAESVEPHVVGMLAVVGREVTRRFGSALQVGINALRNDPLGALGAAVPAQASFVRVNVHVGAMVTDQGLIQGRARETVLYRNRLDPSVRLVCDVLVKHATPLGAPDLAQTARDTFRRGRADVLVVSGSGTGQPTDPGRVQQVRDAVPEAPVWIGSGLTPATLPAVRQVATGAIVGTWLHERGELERPLDVERVRRFVGLIQS